MLEELDILKIVAENSTISQRKIAEKTGMSLGQVNFLIKKCVKKGFIKIEGQTAKSLQYNLTPKGMKEKAERTAEYIKISCHALLQLTQQIKEKMKYFEQQGKKLYILGREDEVMELIRLVIKDIKEPDENCQNAVVFYWDETMLEAWKSKHKLQATVTFENILG